MNDLDTELGRATDMVGAFSQELDRLGQTVSRTQYDVATLEKGLSRGLRTAIDGVVLDGRGLSDALNSVGRSLVQTAYNAALKPVTSHFGGVLANGVNSILGNIMPFANGGALSQGRVMPFAKGGVLSGPTTFPMAGGTGLMGEAGPEAIMPLTRGADGRLGVAAQGGRGGVHITMNINTPDAASFQRSQTQIAATMHRAMARGGRNQ